MEDKYEKNPVIDREQLTIPSNEISGLGYFSHLVIHSTHVYWAPTLGLEGEKMSHFQPSTDWFIEPSSLM